MDDDVRVSYVVIDGDPVEICDWPSGGRTATRLTLDEQIVLRAWLRRNEKPYREPPILETHIKAIVIPEHHHAALLEHISATCQPP